MPQKLFATICFTVVLLFAGAAAARDYEVEVIVFDRIERDAGRVQQERWDFSSARIAARLDEMRALAARASTHPRTAKLASLQPLRERLEARDYRILATARWQQPAAFYPRAPVIALGGGETGDGVDGGLSRHPRSPVLSRNPRSPVLSRNPRSPLSGGGETGDGDGGDSASGDGETAANPNPLAAGFVRVYRTSLIYADVNLQLSPAAEAPGAAWRPHYFIAEKRRLKFKQIHYFDHPLFGAILQVWPVEVDEAEVDDAAADTVDAGITTPQ